MQKEELDRAEAAVPDLNFWAKAGISYRDKFIAR